MPLPLIDPARYEAQLAEKVQRFSADFAELAPPAAQLHRSAPLHYRLRAEFRIWHEGERLDYVMFDPDAPETPIPIDTFPAGSAAINRLMPLLKEYLQQSAALRRKLFQVEFLTTLSGAVLITLLYHRPLDEDWSMAAQQLRDKLDVQLIGRSRKQKIVLGDEHVLETLTVNARPFQYQQIEGGFTQPNGGINQQMLTWAAQQTSALGGDLLELYCGNGNFTAVLAQNFRRVLATEIGKSSVRAAQHNLALNGIGNVELVRMSSDEISTALSGGRAFNRLRHIDLNEYRFSTLLVDPPRAGLDQTTLQLAQRFEHILYISCNPHTLRENLLALRPSHRITALALFDQFPYTHHLECGVLLSKT
jgi:tRNA (uracil-5-)-methyltransferase